MANTAIGLVLVAKTESGWRRLPIVMGKNGKLRAGYGVHGGEPIHFPDAYYSLRTYDGPRIIYKRIGRNAQEATLVLAREQRRLNATNEAIAAGVKVVVEKTTTPENKTLLAQKKLWLDSLEARGCERASTLTAQAIGDFLLLTGLRYPSEIDAASMDTFQKKLRERGNGDRTIFGKLNFLCAWFRYMGLNAKAIVPVAPSYTEREVESYRPEDVKALIKASNEYYRMVWSTLLQTGLRDKEAKHLKWTKVDFRDKVIKVRDDRRRQPNVRIKGRRERSIPLTDALAEMLQQWRQKRPNAQYVLGNEKDRPHTKWLPALKRAAKRAGLNCGSCEGCEESGECSHFYLHKFRATYTTRLFRTIRDARTVMEFTGHKDLATVMRYWAVSDDAETYDKINRINFSN